MRISLALLWPIYRVSYHAWIFVAVFECDALPSNFAIFVFLVFVGVAISILFLWLVLSIWTHFRRVIEKFGSLGSSLDELGAFFILNLSINLDFITFGFLYIAVLVNFAMVAPKDVVLLANDTIQAHYLHPVFQDTIDVDMP